MAEALRDFQLQRIEDLGVALELVQKAMHERRIPELEDVPNRVLYTAAATVLLGQLVIIMGMPKTRKLLFDVADTLLAVVLILVLVVFVVSLPFGAVYIGIRGAYLMARSLIRTFPAVRALATWAMQHLGGPAGGTGA